MPDEFKSSFDVFLPEGVDRWTAVQHLTEYARAVLSKLPGKIHLYEFTLHAEDGSQIERGSVAELQAVVQEYRLTPDRLWGRAYLTPPGKLQWHDNLQVFVSSAFWTSSMTAPIVVRVGGTDKVQVDGVTTQLQREASHLDAPAPLTAVPAPSTTIAIDHELNAGGAHASATPEVPRRETTREWVARTWRDHTAQFIVTVAGGVLVVALAVWLGLSVV